MKSLSLTLSLLLSVFVAVGQATVTGRITSTDGMPLIGAHVELSTTDFNKSTITNEKGQFRFQEVGYGNYVLTVSYIGYQTKEQLLDLRSSLVRVGKIELQEGIELEGIEVKEKVLTTTVQGDTTTFNANAFKTMPDADAQDLVEKMPTVVIEEGKVQAQGEDVKQVLVDGRPFFGNDPTAALRNLPAEVIEKIQIYDQQSDQAQFTGFDDGNTSKTINIITRPNMRTGQFGKLYAGYGYEDRYTTGGNLSIFNGDQRISIIGLSNNINIQNFSTEDLLGVVGSSGQRRGFRGMGSRRGRGGDGGRGRRGGGSGSSVNDFLVNPQGGIATTHAVGLNYSDKWGEQLEITGSYFFNNSNRSSVETLNRAFIDVEEISENYFEQSDNRSDNFNHRLNLVLEYKIDQRNSLILRPRLSWQDNEGADNTLGQTLIDEQPLNRTENAYNTNLNGVNFANNLLFRHRFAKPRRTLSVNVGGGYNNKAGDYSLSSINEFFETNEVELLDQIADLESAGWNASTNLVYTEPIGKRAMLMTNYRFSTNQENSDQQTFDFTEANQAYDALNPELSNVFESVYNTHQTGVGINYRKGASVMMVRASAQWADLDSEQTFPDMFPVNRNFFNILPMAMFRYRVDRTKNFHFFYRTRTQSPSLTQLQNVLDNSNPVQLSTGNPELDQSFQHTLMARYSTTNTKKSSVFYVLLSGSFTNDYIGNSTYLQATSNPIFDEIELAPGVQLSRPTNLDGYWNLRTFVTYGFPISKIKSNLNLNLTGSFNRIPGLINDQENLSDNLALGLGAVLSSNISEKIDFTISSKSNVNEVTNSLQANTDTRYYSQNSKVRFNWLLDNGIIFRTTLTHQLYEGLSEDFNQNFWLWNASIGTKLFKNDQGELAISVFDLLKQNNSIARTVTETYIEDLQTQVLQRYVMLNFTYNLRHFVVKKS